VSIFVGFVLFLTPADSGAVMMANLSCKGGNVDEDAPHWLRMFWSVVITLVTIGLLFAGNFEAMQTMVVLAGLPFSVVLVFFMFGLHKAMPGRADRTGAAELAARGRRGFSERLTQLDLQPSQAVVQRFMDKQVSPALEERPRKCVLKGWKCRPCWASPSAAWACGSRWKRATRLSTK
jgi:choline/glycine/proline betaine transport protein